MSWILFSICFAIGIGFLALVYLPKHKGKDFLLDQSYEKRLLAASNAWK